MLITVGSSTAVGKMCGFTPARLKDSHNILVKALRGHDEIAPVELAERIAVRPSMDNPSAVASVHQVIAQVDPHSRSPLPGG